MPKNITKAEINPCDRRAGEVLCEMRRVLKLSQAEAAKMISETCDRSISRQNIYQCEAGFRRPQIEVLVAMAQVYRVGVDDFGSRYFEAFAGPQKKRKAAVH